jgi:hypothetical protein
MGQAIRISIVTFEPLSGGTVVEVAQETFAAIKPHLQPDRLTHATVYWTLPWQKHRKSALQRTDWQKLTQMELESLEVGGGDSEHSRLYDFNYHYAVNDWPFIFDWFINGELLNNQELVALQETAVAMSKQIFVTTNACTGYISYDNYFYGGTDSPYEMVIRCAPGMNMPKCRTQTRGYYWGNFLTDAHLEPIGGLERLQQVPVHHIEHLPNGYYVQLSENMTDIPRPVLEEIAHLFAPILPQPNPRVPPGENVYRFVLDVPQPTETPPEPPVLMPANTVTIDDFARFVESFQNPPEAREWLANNSNPYPLAGNRFSGREEAQQFVESLYAAGATAVFVSMIHDEAWRIEQEGGPYAESLLVKLPDEATTRAKILAIAEEEMRNEGFLEDDEGLEDKVSEESISLWWD